ncbi:hypothetical protein BHM03_00059639 [Ensete ventricosum]|nr:hypothetical protein BHM03_00059639 [Ensete ventricosum]
MELQPDNRPRSSLGIRSGSNDAMGPRREFARRFTEGIGKLAGNTLKNDQKTHRKNVRGYRIGEEGTTFLEISTGKPPMSNGKTACILESRRLPAADDGKLPKSTAKLTVPSFRAIDDG